MSKEGRTKRRRTAVIAFIAKFLRVQQKIVDYVSVRKERQKHTTKKNIG